MVLHTARDHPPPPPPVGPCPTPHPTPLCPDPVACPLIVHRLCASPACTVCPVSRWPSPTLHPQAARVAPRAHSLPRPVAPRIDGHLRPAPRLLHGSVHAPGSQYPPGAIGRANCEKRSSQVGVPGVLHTPTTAAPCRTLSHSSLRPLCPAPACTSYTGYVHHQHGLAATPALAVPTLHPARGTTGQHSFFAQPW